MEIKEMIERARKAQVIYDERFDQEGVDQVIKAAARTIFDHAEELARLTIDETQMGVYEDKVAKNRNKSKGVWYNLKGKKSMGILSIDERTNLIEIAKPIGVVAGITPMTNPVVTPMSKIIFALKTKNAIIIAPHPKAKQCSSAAVKLIIEAIAPFEVPEGLVQVIEEPTIEKTCELMEACDTWIPLPPREIDKPFLMPVEDVFSITGRGTVATGRIETGIVKVGEEVQIIGLGAAGKKSVVTGVEMFRKLLDQGEAGDNVGLLLRGIDKNEIKRGMVICHPGQVKEHSKFKAEVYILKKEEGGRHTPFHNKYRPQFYIRTLDVTGEITLPEGTEMVMPGDNVTIEVELIYPVACSVGLRFAIREGGRTVGAGQITELEN